MVSRLKVFGILLSLALLGCVDGDLTVTIRYDRIHGLAKGCRVLFEGQPIGDVDAITYSEDGLFDVTVVIPKEYASSVTEHSRFFITDDPAQEGRKALEMIHLQDGGKKMESGARITGTTRTEFFFGQMRRRFEKGLDQFTEEVDELTDKILKETGKPEFKELQKEFERLLEDMSRSGEAAREKIEKELLPELKEELDALKKKLEKLHEDEKRNAPAPENNDIESI